MGIAVGDLIVLTQYDTAVGVQSTLVREVLVNGKKVQQLVDLTNCEVKWNMVDKFTGEVIVNEQDATIDEPASAGGVKYAWQSADVSRFGRYKAEWIRIDADGKREHFPAGDDWIEVLIGKSRSATP